VVKADDGRQNSAAILILDKLFIFNSNLVVLGDKPFKKSQKLKSMQDYMTKGYCLGIGKLAYLKTKGVLTKLSSFWRE
jgi:hypothetical protein